MTAGHNAGGANNAYPKLFMDWLNARYPCLSANGMPGRHQHTKTHASDSITHFTFWSMVTSIKEFDLVLIEFNIGDSFVPGLEHALEDKGSSHNLRGKQSVLEHHLFCLAFITDNLSLTLPRVPRVLV